MRSIRFITFFVIALMTTLETRGDLLKLTPAPSPADNPLKGIVPYSNMAGETFPHSMEFDYLPLSELMMGKEAFDWQPMEALLGGIASRGNQAIFRVWVEYPGRSTGLPKFLRELGVKVTEWKLCSPAMRRVNGRPLWICRRILPQTSRSPCASSIRWQTASPCASPMRSRIAMLPAG